MKNILAEATVEEEFPKDFGIYDLPQFLNGLDLHRNPDFDFQYDRLILSRETLEGQKINAGFGSTQQIGDDKFITSYSYQGIDKKTHLEIVEWILRVVSRRSVGFYSEREGFYSSFT